MLSFISCIDYETIGTNSITNDLDQSSQIQTSAGIIMDADEVVGINDCSNAFI